MVCRHSTQRLLPELIQFRQIIGYLVVGIMLFFTMQALAELTVLYPVNGAFYTYVVRFLDPSW